MGAFSLPNSPWDIQWQRFRSSAETNGLYLEYFIRGELGSEEAMLGALKRGRLQVAGISLQGIASVIPELNVAMTPFLFKTQEEVDWIYDNVLIDEANDLLEEQGLILLRWLESGWFSIASQTPIKRPSDITDLRIGGSPNIAIQSFLSSLGSDAIPIASVDLVPALDTGLVDGAIKPTALVYANLRENVKAVTLLRVAYDTGGLLANRNWYEGLTHGHQHTLKEGHGPAQAVREEVRSMVKGQIDTMRSMGIEVVEPSQAHMMQWRDASRGVDQFMIQEIGLRTQILYDRLVRHLEQFRQSNEVE